MNPVSWAWGKISDKHTFSIAILAICSSAAFIAWLFFVPKVYYGQTAAEAIHSHSERVPVFNMKTNDAQTKMILATREISTGSTKKMLLELELVRHKDRMTNYLNDDGNFKSDRHERIYNDIGDDLEDQMKELEEKLKGKQSVFDANLMVAQRQK